MVAALKRSSGDRWHGCNCQQQPKDPRECAVVCAAPLARLAVPVLRCTEHWARAQAWGVLVRSRQVPVVCLAVAWGACRGRVALRGTSACFAESSRASTKSLLLSTVTCSPQEEVGWPQPGQEEVMILVWGIITASRAVYLAIVSQCQPLGSGAPFVGTGPQLMGMMDGW